MTDTTSGPLGGFEERLLGELREIVAHRSPQARSRKQLRRMTTRPRGVPARWVTVGVALLAAVVVVLVVGTSGSGPASAFAGWSASPTTPSDGELQAAESACQQRNPELASATPTVADTRGPDSLLVYAHDGATTTCVTGQVQLGTVALTRTGGDSLAASGTIAPQSIGLEFAADGQAFREMTGQVATDVTAVTVVLQGGASVQATVATGWFAAWWPVSQDFESGQALTQSLGESVPQSFQITTATGTTTQPLTLNEIQTAMQAPSVDGSYAATGSTGASGSTGATGSAVSVGSNSGASVGSAPAGIDPTLWASFAVVRQPQPSSVQLPEGIARAYTGPAQPPNPYGISPNFAQYVASANTWVLPGSSGVCLIAMDIVFPGVGSGGMCDATQTALSGDIYNVWHGVCDNDNPTGRVECVPGVTVVGFAPDGNTTVTITDADGSTRQVPVTNNVYKVVGGDPSRITLRDASGTLTTVPVATAAQDPSTGGSNAASGSPGATGSTGGSGSSGSIASTGSAPAGMDPALWASFAVLRQPGPNPEPVPVGLDTGYTPGSPSTYPSGVTGRVGPPTNPYGIDPSFDKFAAGADTWIQAGSSGICLVAYGNDPHFPKLGGGSCTSTEMALAGDMFDRIGQTYVGLVPDGNTTVTVTDADGSTRQVPVTDNVYKAVGGNPSSITLRDASGALTTVPIPATGG